MMRNKTTQLRCRHRKNRPMSSHPPMPCLPCEVRGLFSKWHPGPRLSQQFQRCLQLAVAAVSNTPGGVETAARGLCPGAGADGLAARPVWERSGGISLNDSVGCLTEIISDK